MKPLTALLAFMISAQLAASEARTEPPPQQNGWDRYKILIQRNIFSKDRGRPREERRSEDRGKEKETPPPPKPEADITLIGILEKDGKLAAFFENAKTGLIQSAASGDSIARGKIGGITLDRIEYVYDGATVTVAIGNNLEGAAGSKSSGAPQSTSPSSGGNTGPSDANALLERMRKKRQEEMRK